MRHSWVGLIELCVALLFLAGLGVLEWVTRSMDRRRGEARSRESEGDSGHSERQ